MCRLAALKQKHLRKHFLVSLFFNVATAVCNGQGKLHPEPGTGEFLELDKVHLRELLSRVLVQGPVLLHSSVQGAQLD